MRYDYARESTSLVPATRIARTTAGRKHGDERET
jgi:hypothetical protein